MLLSRLEKLEDTYKTLHPKAKLKLLVPVGAKSGMFEIEMLIMQIYPWLSVLEQSSGEVAEGLLQTSKDGLQVKVETAPVENRSPLLKKLKGLFGRK